MRKLALNLLIIREERINTHYRVFDLRSYFWAIEAVKKGYFGRHTKKAFFLEGFWLVTGQDAYDSNADWEFVRFPLFRKDGQTKRLIPNLPYEIGRAVDAGWLK